MRRSLARSGRSVVSRSLARVASSIDRSIARSRLGWSVAWLTGRGAITFVSRTLAQSLARIGRSVIGWSLDIARSVARQSVGRSVRIFPLRRHATEPTVRPTERGRGPDPPARPQLQRAADGITSRYTAMRWEFEPTIARLDRIRAHVV